MTSRWSKGQWFAALIMTIGPPIAVSVGFGLGLGLAFVLGMIWMVVLAFGTDA